MSVRRYETGLRLDAKNRTPQGFLRADAVIARTGVQTYRRADGSLQREYRPPETVFHPDALASFSLAPLTLYHPLVPITAANVREYQVGTIGEVVARRDGKYVATTVLVTDPQAIASVERGDTVELSCGYKCDLDFTPGISPEGEHYDAVQLAVRGNHVALVGAGRAGPEARIKLDGAEPVIGPLTLDNNDAVQVPDDPHFSLNGGRVMANGKVSIKIDGIDFDVKPKVAQAIAKLDKAHADEVRALNGQIAAAKTEAEKARADAAQLKADGEKLKADVAAEKTRADAAIASSATRAGERFALEEKSRKVLGVEVKLDKMTDVEIKTAVVKKLAPDLKLDGKDAAYIQARFDVAIEDAGKKVAKNPAADARFGIGDPNREDAGDDPGADDAAKKEKAAREKFKADARDAWKGPKAASA